MGTSEIFMAAVLLAGLFTFLGLGVSFVRDHRRERHKKTAKKN